MLIQSIHTDRQIQRRCTSETAYTTTYIFTNKMLHKKVTMLTRIVIFCSVLSLTISDEIRPPQGENTTRIPDNQTLPINSTRRAEPVSINISDLLRKYARELSSSNATSFSSSGKKAYIQDDESQTSAPAITLNQLGNGIFDSGPNGNIFGQVTVTDLVPYLVQNVLSPLVQRVIVDGNLVSNFYSLWNGVSQEGTTQPPVPAPAAPPAVAVPPNHYIVGEVAVAEEETTTPKAAPPKRRRTRGSTTTEKSSTSSTGGKGDVIEESNQGEAESTTSKSKYKLITRTRTRPSSTTQQPFEDNQDDEDESLIFHKLSHL